MNVNFSCCPGVPGPSILRLLVIFFFLVSFFSIQPTNPISGNASSAKWKKKGGWAYAKKIINWLHFFFTWLFLYHKEVSRVFSSTSNIAWQFSYKWNQQCAILPQTQIHMYANLVRTKFDTHTVLISLFILLQVLLSSWCSEWKVQLYFPRDLALNFCVAKNFFNNFFVTWAEKEFAYLL